MSDSLSAIRKLLRQLEAGKTDIATFKREFVPLAWTIQTDEPAADLAGEIELRLAEHSDGHWTDTELMEQLSRLAVSV